MKKSGQVWVRGDCGLYGEILDEDGRGYVRSSELSIYMIPGRFSEFEWDKSNIGKNKKHRVADSESEEAFFDDNKVILKDPFHSKVEDRFILLGRTKPGRILFIVFTNRASKIRILSARDANGR